MPLSIVIVGVGNADFSQMDVLDERGDSNALEKSPSVDEREKLSNLHSKMSTLACIILRLESIESTFRKVI